jgi:hypothetical protein
MSRVMIATETDASASRVRTWRAFINRKHAGPLVLGLVEAPDSETARSAALTKFEVTDRHRERLVVRERD